MTDPGFTVSLPDLHGFTDQLGQLVEGYVGINAAIAGSYQGASSVADVKGLLAGVAGILLPTLGAFQDRCDALVEVHCSACRVMARSMESTANTMKRTAIDYERQDREAEAALGGGDASDEEEKTAEAITGGEANSDWSTDFNVEDFMSADVNGTVIPKMSFKPTMESSLKTLEEVSGGPSFASADAVVQYFCGFSPAVEVCKPLLGDWGLVWYVADLFTCSAKAVAEISKIMAVGTDTLTGDDWTGDAAGDFAQLAKTWNAVQSKHVRLLQDSATKLNGIADQMDTEGTKIAEATVVVADIALEIILAVATGGRSALRKEAKGLIDDLIMAVPTVIEGITAFRDFLDLATTDLGNLISEIASLNPPGNLQDTDA